MRRTLSLVCVYCLTIYPPKWGCPFSLSILQGSRSPTRWMRWNGGLTFPFLCLKIYNKNSILGHGCNIYFCIMALIKCEECGHNISDKAIFCPNCGCPIDKKVICKECGYEMSTKDIACPNCGCPNENEIGELKQPKSLLSQKRNGINKTYLIIIAVLIIIGLVLYVFCINNLSPTEAEKGSIENAEEQNHLQTNDAEKYLRRDTIYKNGQVYIKYGAWMYCDLKDAMTDEITHMATNQSENTACVSYGKTNLYLGLTYVNKVSMIGLMIKNGSFETEYLPQIYVRFDDDKVETYSIMVDNQQSIYIVDYDRFINGLNHAKRVSIQVESQGRRKVLFTFDNSGFLWKYPKQG